MSAFGQQHIRQELRQMRCEIAVTDRRGWQDFMPAMVLLIVSAAGIFVAALSRQVTMASTWSWRRLGSVWRKRLGSLIRPGATSLILAVCPASLSCIPQTRDLPGRCTAPAPGWSSTPCDHGVAGGSNEIGRQG